jgi:hypothetical protein
MEMGEDGGVSMYFTSESDFGDNIGLPQQKSAGLVFGNKWAKSYTNNTAQYQSLIANALGNNYSKTILPDSSFTNNTNSVRFFSPSTPGAYTDVSGVSWSGGGSGFDPGWQSPFTISAFGDFNGTVFSADANGWIEMEPWNLMENGGEVTINYTKS